MTNKWKEQQRAPVRQTLKDIFLCIIHFLPFLLVTQSTFAYFYVYMMQVAYLNQILKR